MPPEAASSCRKASRRAAISSVRSVLPIKRRGGLKPIRAAPWLMAEN
jgi:hypothetical protein